MLVKVRVLFTLTVTSADPPHTHTQLVRDNKADTINHLFICYDYAQLRKCVRDREREINLSFQTKKSHKFIRSVIQDEPALVCAAKYTSNIYKA